MKFKFKSIGPIEEAKLEFGDLTIIAGRNNTGKTYLVYTLYGFLKGYREVLRGKTASLFVESHFRKMGLLSPDELIRKLMAEGQFEWEIEKEFLIEEQARLIQEITREFSEHSISGVFNVSQGHFEGTSLEVKLSGKVPNNLRVRIPIRKGITLSIEYDGTRFITFLSRSETARESDVEPFVIREWFEFMYAHFFLREFIGSEYRPFILSSARHSIPLFTNELDFVRNQVVRLLQQREDEENGESILGNDPLESTSRYALAIHDNIDFSRSIPGRAERYDNKPRNVFPEDIERMMGGYFKSVNDDLRFISSAESDFDFDIPLYMASSSAWEMSNLYFYLGYFMGSETSHLLIIDEPESHLDTANQIQFARLLARLVNAGVKVLITTHSDYIVREINNLIMLTSPLEDGDKIKRKLGYEKDDELSQDQVKAYVAGEGTLKECRKNKYGIEMPVFDETIDELNFRSEELASQIMMKDSEG